MRSRFSRRRHARAGFALLETLVAFAIVTAVIAGGTVAVSWAMARQERAAERYHLSEFARTMLTQYVVTYPDTPASGVYRDTYAWRITERPYQVDGLTETGLDMHYREVDVSAWRQDAPSITVTHSTLTARRGVQP